MKDLEGVLCEDRERATEVWSRIEKHGDPIGRIADAIAEARRPLEWNARLLLEQFDAAMRRIAYLQRQVKALERDARNQRGEP